MTTTDYILNAVFVFFVLRQTRERALDARSVIAPLIVVFFVASSYVHSIPTAGNDLVLLGALSAVGMTLGILGGLATHLRLDSNRQALARVGWIAGGLLLLGLLARMGFALAVSNGAEHAIASFSIANQIGSAAWPPALVAMALLEVVVRIAVVQVRARRLANAPAGAALALPVSA
jgi:hypothetical protein